MRHEARDFHNDKKITASMVLEEKIDDHHVFPQAHLAQSRPDVSPDLRDCVLNRTLIDKLTNIRISKQAPSDYLAEIGNAISNVKLQALLESHLLPEGSESPLMSNDFDQYIVRRQELIAKQIAEVTQ